MSTTQSPQFAVAYTAPGQNAHNAPMLNVLGMPVGVKITHAQTYGTFSCLTSSPSFW